MPSAEKDFGWIYSEGTRLLGIGEGPCLSLPTAVREMLSVTILPSLASGQQESLLKMIVPRHTLRVFPRLSMDSPGQFLCSARSPRKAQSGAQVPGDTGMVCKAQESPASQPLYWSLRYLEMSPAGGGAGLWPTYWTSSEPGDWVTWPGMAMDLQSHLGRWPPVVPLCSSPGPWICICSCPWSLRLCPRSPPRHSHWQQVSAGS